MARFYPILPDQSLITGQNSLQARWQVSLWLVYMAEKVTETVTGTGGELLEVLLGKPLRIACIILAGFLAVFLVRILINRVENRVATGEPSKRKRRLGKLAPAEISRALRAVNPASVQRRAQRARTLGSVLRSTSALLISTIVILMVLDELGVSVAPLLASAGIVGVALGFGAQTLVKDFLSGIFMMAEDQYGVGDVIDVGEVSGTVEAVGLRVTRIREYNGTLWYVRNGEVMRVGNMTQMWARVIYDVKIDYNADVEQAEDLLLTIGTELAADPNFKDDVLEAPELTGIEDLDAEGVQIRLIAKTTPGMQWAVGRELRRRTKAEFDAQGIALAKTRVHIETRDGVSSGA